MKPETKTLSVIGLTVIVVLAGCSTTDSDSSSDSVVEHPATVTTTATDEAATSPESTIQTTAAAGPDFCRTLNLDIDILNQQGAAGSMILEIGFTNSADSPCLLEGFPGASLVGMSDGTQLGAPATRENLHPDVIELQPAATASASLKISRAENFDADECGLTDADGLRVYPPGETASAFIPLESIRGCAAENFELMSIRPVEL